MACYTDGSGAIGGAKSTDFVNTNWSDLAKVDDEKKKDFRDNPPIFNVPNPNSTVAYNQNAGSTEGGFYT